MPDSRPGRGIRVVSHLGGQLIELGALAAARKLEAPLRRIASDEEFASGVNVAFLAA